MKTNSTILCLVVIMTSTAFGQINCPSHLPFTLVGNTEYCVGTLGSELSVPETYDGYEWLPTSETGQNVLLTAGNYQLVVTHYTGCTDTMDIEVLQVPNPPQPTITASGPTEFCEGETVTLSGPSGYPYYEWNTGSVSQSITVYESGTFVLSIEDWIGCGSASNLIQVVVNPKPTAAFSPDLEMFNISFNNLSYDATSYEWNFGDGTTSSDFEPVHTFNLNGEVGMYLVAENDCGTDTAFLNLTSVNVEDNLTMKRPLLYPNPVSNILFVQSDSFASSPFSVELYNPSGQRVLTHNSPNSGSDKLSVDVSRLPTAIYTARIMLGNRLYHSKISVINP